MYKIAFLIATVVLMQWPTWAKEPIWPNGMTDDSQHTPASENF
jgi:hypothetical protein